MLAVSGLALPAAPANADEDEKSWRIDHSEAACAGEALTSGVRDAQAPWSGLGADLWRNPEEGALAGISLTVRERWRHLDRDRFPHAADDGLTRIGSRAAASGDLLLGSAFRFTAGDAESPDRHWLAWRRSAPEGSARGHDAGGDAPMGVFAAECERDRLLATMAPTERLPAWSALDDATAELTPTRSRGDASDGSWRHWRTAIGAWRVALTPWEADGGMHSSGPGAFGMPITFGAVPDGAREYKAGSGGIVAPPRGAGIDAGGGVAGASVELEVALGYGTR